MNLKFWELQNLECKYLDQSYQKEWEDLTKENPASGFMQSFAWNSFTGKLGWTTFKIGVFSGKQLIGGALIGKYPFSKDKNYLAIPEGPVLPYGQKPEKIFHRFMREVDVIANLSGKTLTTHLRIEPKLTTVPSYFNRFQKAPVNQQPLSTRIVDLSLNEEQLLQQMKQKGRYNIHIAKKHGVEIFSTSLGDGIGDFLSFYHATVERNQFEGKEEDYFIQLVAALDNPHLAKFFFAKVQKTIVASALVVFYGSIATYLFGASSQKHREAMASYLLHWEIIQFAKSKGFTWYDFYGVSPDDADVSHPWHGFTMFKNKFGGKKIDYIGAYDFVYNKTLYQEYLKESGEISWV